MLKINKSINLNGEVTIDGVQVAWLNAAINADENSGTNINRSITNQELYNANKTQIRADIAEFEKAVYECEDSISPLSEK